MINRHFTTITETFVEERNAAEYTNYLFSGKELDTETGLYYFGARYYDARVGSWYGVDKLSDKYPSMSGFMYCAGNPVKLVDPDGKVIIFIVRGNNRGQDVHLTYRNGNFYNNNEIFKSGKGSISPTLDIVLASYRKIEKSNDNVLKNQLHKLEKSSNAHYIEKSPNERNAVRSSNQDKSDSGKPVGTQTEFDFDVQSGKEYFETIVHEMRHQFDHDIGNMKDNSIKNDENDPAEIRATYNENRAKDILGKKHKTTYDGKKIDSEKLRNPPNNKQVDDVH